MDELLIGEVRSRDKERWLSVLWGPEKCRASLLALHAYDLEMERILATIEDPLLAEIRLAWWREQLEGLAEQKTPQPQPLLQALVVARDAGVDMLAFSQIEDGFLPLLAIGAPEAEELDVADMAKARGQALFRAMGKLLGGDADVLGQAGYNWGLAQLVRGTWGCRAAGVEKLAIPAAKKVAGKLPAPMAALAKLAVEDLSRHRKGQPLRTAGSAGRQWRMLWAALAA